MREIKFRAYVNNPIHGKGVFPVKSIHFDPFVCEVVMRDEIVNFFDFDDIALLEYTGLKDKNGTEIYEGDITKTIDGLGVIIYEPKLATFAIEYRSYKITIPHYLDSEKGNDLEVLGNIYEHPHLLGGEGE
jgi:uncharacterized phage protein (TIGR01671 family)